MDITNVEEHTKIYMIRNNVAILKPADMDSINDEYKELKDFMVSSCGDILQEYGMSEEAIDVYTKYKNNLILGGERMVIVNRVGPPNDTAAVLLNKFAEALNQDEKQAEHIFPFYQMIELIKERGFKHD